MPEAKNGDKVKIHYTGYLENGEQFNSTRGENPLEVNIGNNEIFPAVEHSLIGMKPGDKKTITLQPEQAFGQHLEAMVLEIDESVLPADCPREVGIKLKNKQPSGRLVDVYITKIEGNQVTLDANHPLAGKTLTIDIEMLEIVEN